MAGGTNVHYIEIKSMPDVNGNRKRIYLLLDAEGCQISVTSDSSGAIVRLEDRVSASLEVTLREFRQWAALAKAQEGRAHSEECMCQQCCDARITRLIGCE
jgi:hypothetical protein